MSSEQWDLGCTRTLDQFGDSFEDKLKDLDYVKAYNLDEIVKSNMQSTDYPASVDCFLEIGESTLLFIEFKGRPNTDLGCQQNKDIDINLCKKLAESLVVYDKFLKKQFKATEIECVIVENEYRRTLESLNNERAKKDVPVPSNFKKYYARDRHQNPVFYSKLRFMQVGQFVSHIKHICPRL